MKRLTHIFPWLTPIRIWQKQSARHVQNWFNRKSYAVEKSSSTAYPYTNKKHQSLLRRKLGDSDPILQENKIVNLNLASRAINGVVIQPGETFSFWNLVGKTSKKKGYIDGMLLSNGQVCHWSWWWDMSVSESIILDGSTYSSKSSRTPPS